MSHPQWIERSVDNPWKEHHNKKATNESIKKILSGGTPDWLRFPNDFKQYAIESYQAEKEASDSQVLEYKMGDQNLLIDVKARFVNIMASRDFIKKLRDNGIKCFTVYNGLPQTVALWVICPTTSGVDAKYMCYMQVPAMIEWSVLKLDAHGLPAGEEYRGWRTCLSQMILKGGITEEKAHEIFGRPTDSIVSRKYRETLWQFRHRKLNSQAQEF